MNATVLDNFSFEIDHAALIKKMRVSEGSPYVDDLKRFAHDAQTIGRPKALYKVARVESKNDKSVVVDGDLLTSRVLRMNLDKVHRVFPFVATCGTELEDWANSMDDLLHHYWALQISEMALHSAREYLQKHIEERYRLIRSSSMDPGSLPDWPLKEQRALFKILGNPKDAIGVQLMDSKLMLPIKSTSGIRFPTEESFTSCQLCLIDDCPNRRLPYDADLYHNKYRLSPTAARHD